MSTDRVSQEKINQMTIDDLDFSIGTVTVLNHAGINTVADLKEKSYRDLLKIPHIGRKRVEEIFSKLELIGVHIEGREEFITEKQGITRAETIAVDVASPEYSTYTKGGNGFTVYITVTNQTPQPIKLELVDCSVFSGKRKRPSDYNYEGYLFSEEYIFPNDAQTFGKIWLTKKWETSRLVPDNDYITVTFKNASMKRLYYFKFALKENSEHQELWEFSNYYEVDA